MFSLNHHNICIAFWPFRTPHFLAGGTQLWEAIKAHTPTILTGTILIFFFKSLFSVLFSTILTQQLICFPSSVILPHCLCWLVNTRFIFTISCLLCRQLKLLFPLSKCLISHLIRLLNPCGYLTTFPLPFLSFLTLLPCLPLSTQLHWIWCKYLSQPFPTYFLLFFSCALSLSPTLTWSIPSICHLLNSFLFLFVSLKFHFFILLIHFGLLSSSIVLSASTVCCFVASSSFVSSGFSLAVIFFSSYIWRRCSALHIYLLHRSPLLFCFQSPEECVRSSLISMIQTFSFFHWF